MPAIINSDDGVSSGTAGLKTSGSNDGITVFQQNGTESMRIDSSGNITVKDKIQFGIDAQTHIQAGGTSDVDLIVAADTNIRFETATNERARIDSSGNMGIGTSSPSGNGRLELNVPSGNNTNLTFYENGSSRWLIGSLTSSNAFRFYDLANAAERARITSAGVFFVGVTAQQGGGSHCIQAGTGVNSLQMQNNGATPYGPYINFSAAAPNNASQYFIQCSDTAATRMLLYANGGLANYQANDVNLSDRREKTNFAPAKSYLDTICAIPVQTFNYIDQSENDPGLTLGVVAQDVQAVAPELVTESNWGTKDDPKMRLSIYQTDLQYALMKCIQELKAELDATKAEVAALKARTT